MTRRTCMVAIAATLLCMSAAWAQHHGAHQHESHQHDAHQHHAQESSPSPAAADPHAAHRAMPDPHAAHRHVDTGAMPREPIPSLEDADREAAFPLLTVPMAHGSERHWKLQFDRIELHDATHGRSQAWEAQAWIGGDTRRLWLRSEGERAAGQPQAADLELLHGWSVSPWWELVAGVRHDWLSDAAGQTLAVLGIQGMAPYRLDVSANAYIGGTSRAALKFEVEYDLLLSNRLVLQPTVEVAVHARNDAARRIGQGLGSVETGLRLRYEMDRRFAPYIGYAWSRTHGKTAELRQDTGDPASDRGWVAGVRIWF